MAPLYPQKLAITSPTSGGRSVGIVRSRTQTMEFFFIIGIWQGVISCQSSEYHKTVFISWVVFFYFAQYVKTLLKLQIILAYK
jgi:hypothetical protein